MSKKTIFLLFTSAILLSSCSPFGNGETKNAGNEAAFNNETATWSPEHELTYEERVELTRKRVALRSIIRKWDYYKARNDAETAIRYYENVASKIENDPSIYLRLADSYYEVKNFQKAYEYYQKISIDGLDEPAKLRFIGSIMSDPQRKDKAKEVEKYAFSTGTKEYYALVDSCSTQVEKCIDSILASNSTDPRITELLSFVKSTSQISDDIYYKLALVAGKFYEQHSYFAAKSLSEYILKTRPDYREVMKIRGYSEYEIGSYKESADWLEKYYTLEPNDAGTAYMLGIIHFYKEDYATSNLYFNAAVLSGYTPKTELERRLVYNYTLLGDTIGAFKIFRYLLNEDDVTSEDFQIAIYMALNSNDLPKAALWSQKSLSKFGEDSNLLAFAGQIARISNNMDDIEPYLLKALEKQPDNAFALLEMGRLYLAKNDYTLAKEHFEKSVKSDSNGYFWSEAKNELSLLEQKIATASWATGSTVTEAPTLSSQ